MAKLSIKKRISRVLQEPSAIETVCLAQVGKGNDLLRRNYNIDLTDGQIQYRLSRAKTLAGLKKGDGFRKAWREGRSPYEQVVTAIMPTLRKDYKNQILTQVERANAFQSANQEETQTPATHHAKAA